MFSGVRRRERKQAHKLQSLLNEQGILPFFNDNTILAVVAVVVLSML